VAIIVHTAIYFLFCANRFTENSLLWSLTTIFKFRITLHTHFFRSSELFALSLTTLLFFLARVFSCFLQQIRKQ